MPWSNLSETQQKFLKTYLKSSFWDFVSGIENSDKNKTKIADFESFETLEKLYAAALEPIPGDYKERVALKSGHDEAISLRDSGKFAEASKVLTPLIEDAKQTVSALKDQAEYLRKTVKPVIDAANEEERDEIDQIHARIAARLTAAIPTRADMSAADEARVKLKEVAARIEIDITRRNQAREDFDLVFADVRDDLKAAAEFDASPYARTPQKGALDTAIQAAVDLLRDAKQAEKDDKEAGHNDLAQRLEAWKAKRTSVPDLVQAGKDEINQALNNVYAAIWTRLEEASTHDVQHYSTADKNALAPVISQISDDMDEIRQALNSKDHLEQLRVYDRASDVTANLEEFDRLEKLAKDNQLKVWLNAQAVSPGHKEAIAKLSTTLPDVLDQVTDIIASTTSLIGNVEVTAQLISDRKKAKDVHLKEWQRLGKTLEGLNKQITEGNKASELLVKGVETLKEKIKTLTGSTATGAAEELKQAQEELLLQEAAVVSKANEVNLLAQQKVQAEQDRQVSADGFLEEKAYVAACEKKKKVMDAVSFGALAPDSPSGLDAGQKLRLVKMFDEDPEFAENAVKSAASAKYPESSIKAAETVSGRIKGKFDTSGMSDTDARRYADNLVLMAANLPPDVADKLEGYLDSGKHKNASPEVSKGATYEELVKNRTGFVGKSLLKDDGDFDLAKGNAALDDVLFHPDSMWNPTPALATHMLETMDYFKNSMTANAKIKGIVAPTDPSALGLLARGSGKTPDTIDKRDTQTAVVNAMLTPVYQGKVGSCFATASVVKLRQTDPDRALDTFTKLATTGKFKPVVGDEVSVVQNVPVDEDPLVRTLEYTAATACAIASDSENSKSLARRTKAGVAKAQDKIKPESWNAVKAKLETAVAEGFSFIYNPEATITDSNDGSSSKGRYELVAKDGGKSVNSEEDYVKAATKLVLAQIGPGDLKSGVTEDQIKELVKSRDFLDAMKVENKMPWELASGGQTAEATKVMFGGNPQTVGFLPEANASTSTIPDRSKKILGGLVEAFDGSTDKMATVRTVGMHGFNALPNHPSLAKLKVGGKSKVTENLDKELIAKGTELKDVDLAPERVAYMLEQDLNALAVKQPQAVQDALAEAILANIPTAPMKPAAYKALVKTATTTFVTLKAKAAADDWKAAEKKKKTDNADPSEEDYNKELAKVTKEFETFVEGKAINRLVKDLGAPEFVIADTNWGSGIDHTYFVVAPDPSTGEPMMFQKKDPPGTLTPATKDWVDANWAQVK